MHASTWIPIVALVGFAAYSVVKVRRWRRSADRHGVVSERWLSQYRADDPDWGPRDT